MLKRKEPLTDSNLLFAVTIGIFVVMYVSSIFAFGGGFTRPQQFLNLFNENAYLIIIACGLSVVMVGGGIDISVGGVTALVCMCSVVAMDDKGFGVIPALLIALSIGLAFGIVQGLLVSYLDIQPFIVSLAGMFFARGMTTIVEVRPRTIQHELFIALKNIQITIPGLGYTARNGNYIAAKIELGVIVAIMIVVLIFCILKWTRFGRNLYAVGGNVQSALMLGINVKRTKLFSYMLCGLLAGIGGYVYLLHTGSGAVTNATGAEMKAIAASIIGGTLLTGGVGNVIGTPFGVLALGTINNIVVALRLQGPWWQGITTGMMLCFFIVMQSLILAYRKRSRTAGINPSEKKLFGRKA
ncbi:MAG: sugar ABC transporter permease YjfF [Treponema sp.]|jgi:simple sugar transport system permease protein|nr:sugar ABC transporter permease YjfF [Treponema sp.]